MKSLTVAAEKGGTGKTTTTFNLAGKWADQGLRILLIDSDKSANLTKRYRMYHHGKFEPENYYVNIYKNQPVKPYHVKKNIDLLASSEELDKISDEIRERPNNHLILLTWIVKNNRELSSKYDIIMIDTHNDATLLEKNAWAVSDVILGISDPSTDGFEALVTTQKNVEKLKKELVDPITGTEYMVARYYAVGNKVKHNTNSSREFLEFMNGLDNYLGYISEKELLNSGNLEMKTLVDMTEDPKVYRDHREFTEQTWDLFETIKKELYKGE